MQATRIKELLPAVFQQAAVPYQAATPQKPAVAQQPLYTCLEIMERFHAPVEKKLDELDRFIDPRRAPEEFIPFLAGWVDIDFPVTTGRMRELIAGFVDLLTMRGTRQGLIRLLERATGVTGFEVHENPLDERGATRPFHIDVVAPAALKAHRKLLEVLIEREKPAYVTSALSFKKD
jgi:phage tail-like protein